MTASPHAEPAAPVATTPRTAAPPTTPAAPSRGMLRFKSVCLFVPCATLLVVAAFLHPSARGVGTHQQLGLPPCGFKVVSGLPCPTCGMTTSFSYAAHGRLIDSFLNQPMGAVLAVMTACLALLALYGIVTGANLAPLWNRLFTARFMLIMGALLIVAWIYKILLITGKA